MSRVVTLCRWSCLALAICWWIRARLSRAFSRLRDPFCLRLNAFCARRSCLSRWSRCLGLATFSPVLRVTRLLIPTSKPTALVEGGKVKSRGSSNRRLMYHCPAAFNRMVTVDGSTPSGNDLDHRIFNGSEHFARNTLPSFHLKADLVNSALPPLRFFLKLGYFARPAKKLLKADCRCLNPCYKGTLLTSLRNCRSSCFFHAVNKAEL
jgi:hypothetical protein